MPFCNFPKRHNTEEKKKQEKFSILFPSSSFTILMTTPIFSVCLSGLSHKLLSTKKKKRRKIQKFNYNNNLEIVMMWWLLLCGFISHWSRREEFHTKRNKTLSPPFKPNPPFLLLFLLSTFFFFSICDSLIRDPMKEITDSVDPRIMFKHQSLLQDYHELRKETEFKMRKLEMMKQRRSNLDAEVRFIFPSHLLTFNWLCGDGYIGVALLSVFFDQKRYRFLRRRYKHLKQDQTLETSSPNLLGLSESGDVKVPSKRKSSSLRQKEELALDNKNSKRRRGDEVLTNATPLPDLNGGGSTFKVPAFDLNKISREEEEPEANGGQVVVEATKKAMLGSGNDDLRCEMKLPICRDVEKELNRAAVKRKVSWQDPVALSV
ncbi:hypothetical protein IGI04_000663 [Brassica rapa subsp. trilocularis]|uniref:Uncharacterized protein n=1 Tax=Brassica rapa subsp. trilocularis TaxID=1813537 RepID=A0ABQ7NRH2_BRACM|nr:hypothetical protein IGI04_000663 [Brassica rapa subsp. trilocularis]